MTTKTVTTQDLFNTMVLGLRKQGRKSVDAVDPGTCLYRGHSGTKCAVGMLITDVHYYEDLEYKSFSSERVLEVVQKSIGRKLSTKERRLCSAMQVLHDETQVAELLPDWEMGWKNLAAEYGLTVPE